MIFIHIHSSFKTFQIHQMDLWEIEDPKKISTALLIINPNPLPINLQIPNRFAKKLPQVYLSTTSPWRGVRGNFVEITNGGFVDWFISPWPMEEVNQSKMDVDGWTCEVIGNEQPKLQVLSL